MRATERRRGFSTLIALFVCSLLLAVGLALLSNAIGATVNARAETVKAQVTNAAHSGLDTALDAIDVSANTTVCASGTVNGMTFTCGMLGSFQSTADQNGLVDPCTGATLAIAKGLEIMWSKSSAADGERPVCVEGVVSAPIAALSMPDNAVTANKNIGGGGHVPILADPTDTGVPHDADVYANGNISSFTNSVNGNTYAVGSDGQTGYDGKTTHSGAAPVILPTAAQVAAFQTYIQNQTSSGTQLTAAKFLSNGSQTYSGNVYINGNVDMTQGTVTFGGADVYVNGYLCLSGQASIVNNGGGVIMVSKQFAQAGNASGYQVGTNPKGVLAVMGTDTTPGCGAADGPYAASVSGNGNTQLGVLWTPNGSIQIAGNGNLTGMLVAGSNVQFNGGGSGGGFTFDHRLENLTIQTPTFAKVLGYAEF